MHQPNRRKQISAAGVVGLAVAATTASLLLPVLGQGASANYRNEVRIQVRDGYRTIESNGIPDHVPGTFPNRGNPNAIRPKQYRYRVPAEPRAAAQESPLPMLQCFGVAVNGVPFDPGAAEFWNGDRRWQYEPLAGFLLSRGGLGVDEHHAHVQPDGAYHYHGLPTGLLKRLDWQGKMALIGYAADGYPIYGPYAYANPKDPSSGLKLMKASYRVKAGNRPEGAEGPGGAHDGSFVADYEYAPGSGTLDACNGRSGVTPEYPNGTYYYVITDNWPFIPRRYHGTPDVSFRRGPGVGGPGGPMGGPGGEPGRGGPSGLAPAPRASITAADGKLYILRGDELTVLDARTLEVIRTTRIRMPVPRGGRP